MPDDPQAWWTGRRGEWLVAIQAGLMALVFLGPRAWDGPESAALPWAGVCRTVGPVLMVAGMALVIAGAVRLGRGLTPLPYPKADAPLIESGPFGLVRHPMYSGGVLLGLGWALFACSWLTLAYVVVLFAFLDLKSRREEAWLADKFQGYRDYQKRVRRLIPFLY